MKKDEVKIPLTPNFIIQGGVAYPIKEFSDGELSLIGHRWTENLIAKAQKRRGS